MTWNYRVLFHYPDENTPEGWFAVHEVYYDDEGQPEGWTAPITFQCYEDEGPDGVRKSLAMALADAVRLPVLVERDGKLVERI